MFATNGRRRRKSGRPAYDKLAVFLHVTAGTQREGMSVHAFCERFPLVVVSKTEDGVRVVRMKGPTLRRRFMEVRHALIDPDLEVINDALHTWVKENAEIAH